MEYLDNINKITPEELIRQNRDKWYSVDNKYGKAYTDLKNKLILSDFDINDQKLVFKKILDLYIESIKATPENILIISKLKQNIINILDSIDYITMEEDYKLFLCQLESLVNVIVINK